MELQFPSIQVLFTFLVFVILVLKLGKRCKTRHTPSNLPPGPWKLPIIGNLHQLIGDLPHHRFRDLAKKHGPIMYLRLGEFSAVVISSAELAKEVMTTHDIILGSRPEILASKIMAYGSKSISFSPYGDYWRQLRRIATQELLSTKRVQSFQLIREDEVLKLTKWIASKVGTPINLTKEINSSTFSITARSALGKQSRDQDDFISIIKEVLKAATGFAVEDIFPSFKLLHMVSGLRTKLERLQKQADRIAENIIKEHIQAKEATSSIGEGGVVHEDLVDVLLKYHANNGGSAEFPLTTEGVKALILEMFAAGSETSATTTEWAMSEMVKNPRIMKRAQEEVREVFNRNKKINETGIKEMKYLKLVIKETLRLHLPGVLLIPRECGEKCEIGGYEIPVKTKVIVNAWAIGRDPKYWTASETFYPERFLDSSIDYQGHHFEYLPFGGGRRICPGISFGLANVELLLALFLYHFDWKLPSGMKNEDLDMTEAFRATVCRKQDLHLIPIPYHPPSF